MVVAGKCEVSQGTLSLRKRNGEQQNGVNVNKFLADRQQRIRQRAATL